MITSAGSVGLSKSRAMGSVPCAMLSAFVSSSSGVSGETPEEQRCSHSYPQVNLQQRRFQARTCHSVAFHSRGILAVLR